MFCRSLFVLLFFFLYETVNNQNEIDPLQRAIDISPRKLNSRAKRGLSIICLFLHRTVCPFILFLLAIVFSVLLRFTASDYPFGIYKLFFWPLCCLSFFDKNQIKIINVCLGTEMVYYCDLQFLRKVCWYHRGNQTPWIEEGQTTQWPKEKPCGAGYSLFSGAHEFIPGFKRGFVLLDL
jgi:hypothetical protein